MDGEAFAGPFISLMHPTGRKDSYAGMALRPWQRINSLGDSIAPERINTLPPLGAPLSGRAFPNGRMYQLKNREACPRPGASMPF